MGVMFLLVAQLVPYQDSRRLNHRVPSNHNTRWQLMNLNHNFMIKSKNISFPTTILLGGIKSTSTWCCPVTDCIIRQRPINLPYIMMKNMIMTNNQKQKSLPYGQCLSTIFLAFQYHANNTNTTSYYKHLEIDHINPTKMKFVLMTKVLGFLRSNGCSWWGRAW